MVSKDPEKVSKDHEKVSKDWKGPKRFWKNQSDISWKKIQNVRKIPKGSKPSKKFPKVSKKFPKRTGKYPRTARKKLSKKFQNSSKRFRKVPKWFKVVLGFTNGSKKLAIKGSLYHTVPWDFLTISLVCDPLAWKPNSNRDMRSYDLRENQIPYPVILTYNIGF